MSTFFSTPAAIRSSSALARTFTIWLLSNLGGTGLLALGFSLDNPADFTIPLLVGLMAALISLAYVPLAWPFFALAQRACTSWRCQLLAVVGVVVVFGVANYLLLQWLPIGSFGSLLTFSGPYLGAALLAVVWLYWPQQAGAGQRRKATLAQLAPLLIAWGGRARQQHSPLTQLR